MIGTNNLKSGHVRMPPVDVAEGIARIIDVLLAKLPTTRILLCAILPRNSAHQVVFESVAATNLLLPELARRPRVYYTDFGERYLGPDGKVRRDLMPDSLHPNEAGFGIWAESIRHPSPFSRTAPPSGSRFDGSGFWPALPRYTGREHSIPDLRLTFPAPVVALPLSSTTRCS